MATSTPSLAPLGIIHIGTREPPGEPDDGGTHTLTAPAGRRNGHRPFRKWTMAFRILLEQGNSKYPKSRVLSTP